MALLNNYELQGQLYGSARTSVYRAVRRLDQQPVVIKTSSSEYPSARELSRLRREFSLLRQLDLPGVVRVHALESWGNRLAIVQEPQEEPLSSLLRGAPLGLPTFFAASMALTKVVVDLHAHLAHLDLTPHNVFWRVERASASVVDFAQAVPIMGGTPVAPDDISEASMPYVAPEQSGRMNRSVDQRADLYSLGAIFYELLTGERLFEAASRSEWLYAHVTRQPNAPSLVQPSVPPMLSDLVLRLLEKDPEQRYQTSAILLRDLRECRDRWAECGSIPSFSLSRRTAPGLRASHALHGRAAEVQALLAVYDATRAGATRAAVIAGPAGVGKSALMRHLRALVSQLDGYFVQGKADPFGSARPYAALAEAFRQLTAHILSEPDDEVARWATALNAALAPNAQLLLDIVPELEQVIGPQPRPAPGNPVEEQNRFSHTIIAFIQCVAKPMRPLVLFLDDVHWLDTATLHLIERILCSNDVSSFLVVGAQRGDAAFFPSHEADNQRRVFPAVLRLTLPPLQLDAGHFLLVDMLDQSTDDMRELAEVVHDSARGNPLHFVELVKLLEKEQAIGFDAELGRWTWDLDRVRSVAAPQELADLVLTRFRGLGAETQRALSVASCIGSCFEAGFLAAVCDLPYDDLRRHLDEARRHGFIVDAPAAGSDGHRRPASVVAQPCFRFRHDGVQQAAHSELTEAARREAHRRIGNHLVDICSKAEHGERSIEIAHHLNEAAPLLASELERASLLRLNLVAAARATLSAAHDSAYDLLVSARRLLPPTAFEDCFDLAVEVHYRLAAGAYLVRELDVAEQSCDEILRRSRDPLERARVYAMQLAQLTFCGRMDAAVAAGSSALQALGIKLGPRPSRLLLLKDFIVAWWRMAGRSIADIEHQPLLSDERARLCLQVLIDFIPSSYLTGNDRLFAASVLKQVNLSLRFGNGPEAASAYASFTVLLAGLGSLRRADEFGRLALRLQERFAAHGSRCRNYLLYALFAHSWTRPWAELRRWFQDAVQAGLDSGDHLFTAYGCGWVYLWDPNVDIETAYEESKKYIAIIDKTDYQNARDAALLAQQLWLNLLGRTSGPLSLGDALFDEVACDRRMREARYMSGLGIHALYRVKLCVYYEAWAQGFDVVQKSAGVIRALVGSPYMVEYCLHAFLVCVSVRDPKVARRARPLARRFRGMMSKWAAQSPENFGPHALLMDAEWAALRGDTAEATRLFHAAAGDFNLSRGARYEALANERAALFFIAQRLPRLASVYLSIARYHYARWGAVAKVRFLEQRYPSLFELATSERVLAQAAQTDATPDAPQERGLIGAALAVEKAFKALAVERPLEQNLQEWLAIVRETFGATRSAVLLKDADGVQLRAYVDAGGHHSATPATDAASFEQANLPERWLRYVARRRTPLLLDEWENSPDFVRDKYLDEAGVRSALAVPMVCRDQLLGVVYAENRNASRAFTKSHLAILETISLQAAVTLQNTRLGERLERMRDSFARVVPPEFLTSLGRKNFTEIRMGDSVQKEMTVLFSDLRGFTTIVESLGASSSMDFVNEYLSRMAAPILHNGGFIDSYAGDAIMALFSLAPVHAVRAALSMLEALEDLNALRLSEGRPRLEIGVGISTGPLTLGTIGGVEHFKYGVVGDPVNLAARIEGVTKFYGVPLIISRETWSRLDAQTRDTTRCLGRVRVAGRHEPVELFEVFAADPLHRLRRKRELSSEWSRAMDSYGRRRFLDAARSFAFVRDELVHDRPASMFAERALASSIDPPGPDWTPIEVLTQK